MKLSVREILEATQADLVKGEDLSVEFYISTDTRTIKSNELFLPLKGENFDGHNFIKQAIDRDCGGYFLEKTYQQVDSPAEFVISVDNAHEAYLRVARFARRKINPKVIAVTGSSGKTSVKEFIYTVLSASFKTHKSKLNHNNEIGLCQTLLSMPESSQYAVIEMGMRATGEIGLLSEYSEPDVAIITNIGTAHIGRLGSIENIAKAKCEITSYLKESGLLLAYDDDLVKNSCTWQGKKLFYGKDYEITCRQENMSGFYYKNEYYEVPAMGEYNVINAIAAIETGKYAGMDYESIKQGLLNYAPVESRGNVIHLSNSIKLIVDCYNANPDSVMASVDSLVKTCKNSKIILILGDMAELGEYEQELHGKVGTFISKLPVSMLVTVGEKAKFAAHAAKSGSLQVESFLSNLEAAEFLQNNIDKNSILFFKASRCMKLEEIAAAIQQKYPAVN